MTSRAGTRPQRRTGVRGVYFIRVWSREAARKAAPGTRRHPLEFTVGRAFEVWADPALPEDSHGGGGSRSASVMSRYSKAWDEYLHLKGIDRKEGMRQRPERAMSSVDFLMAEGRRAEVEQRLARVGARATDLPDLRVRAERWLMAYRLRVGHR